MPKDADLPSISMANTKKEMLQAYSELKNQLQQLEDELLDAKKIREQQQRERTATAAAEAVASDPVNRIAELKQALVAELDDLTGRFAAERDRYRALCTEIEHKQADLDRIYGVETAAIDLAALLQAHKAEQERFTADMAQRKADLEAEITARKNAWKDEAAQYELKRQREREDHAYEWSRELNRKQTELEDKLADLNHQLQANQAEFDAQCAERERALAAREEAVAEREHVMDDLRARVEAFPAERDEAVGRAVDETTRRLQSEHTHVEKLLSKEYEGQIHVLEGRIESLTDRVASQARQIEALTGQQEKAYEKVQDIASKAVAGATRTIITSTAGERGGNRREEERE